MHNRYFLLFCILLTGISSLNAQKGSINGIITNAADSEPVPYATIAILGNNSQSSMGTVSDGNGRFEIKSLPAGNYDLVISFIGFRTDTLSDIEITKESPLADLGNVKITVSNVQLDEVEISTMANTSTTRIDRRAYRAADFETARGGTATDILNKLPSISVSPDGEVSVRGTTDFMVYLNGKPTQMDPSVLLGQISGDAIEQIEVITVPTAKYDAQGKGGIINISTKTKGAQGLTVSVNGLGGGAPWGHTSDPYVNYHMNDYRYGGNLNLLYTNKNFSAYGGFNYSMKNVNGERYGAARILDADRSVYKHMVADGERPEWYENYTANAGFSYRFSERSSLSASYYYGNRTEGRSAYYIYHVFYADQDKNEVPGIPMDDDWIFNPNTDNRYGTFNTANLDYTFRPDASSELKVSLLYEHSGLSRELENFDYDFDEPNDQPGAMREYFHQTDDTPLNGYQVQIDYQKELAEGQILGIGFQPQLFSINGIFEYDTLNIETSVIGAYSELENSIDLSRNIYAGYLNYEGNWDQLSLIAGLRLEYTDQLMEIGNPDYFTLFDRTTESEYSYQQLDWFPVVHAAYSMENSRFIFAASRRINRPPIKNMAPFLYRRHHEVYVVGDPVLKPEYITSAELSFEQDFGKNNVVLTGFIRDVENEIFRVNTVYYDQLVLIRSYTNSGESQSIGAEINSNFELGKKAKLFLGGSLYNYHIQGNVFGYEEDNNSINWNVKGVFNIMPVKQLRWSTDFDMQSATVTAQGNNTMFYFLNTALTYQPVKLNNLGITFKVLDILGSNKKGLDTRAFDMRGTQIFFQETMYTRFGPIAELSISYAFNSNGKSAKKGGSAFGVQEF